MNKNTQCSLRPVSNAKYCFYVKSKIFEENWQLHYAQQKNASNMVSAKTAIDGCAMGLIGDYKLSKKKQFHVL